MGYNEIYLALTEITDRLIFISAKLNALSQAVDALSVGGTA